MPHDYIPRPDGDFSAWANHYYAAVKKWWDAQGLDPDRPQAARRRHLDLWNKDYAAHIAAQARAEAAAAAKRQARHGIPTSGTGVPPVIPVWNPKPAASRRSSRRTPQRPRRRPRHHRHSRAHRRWPARANADHRTLARVGRSGRRLTRTLRSADESTPTRRAKPRGVRARRSGSRWPMPTPPPRPH